MTSQADFIYRQDTNAAPMALRWLDYQGSVIDFTTGWELNVEVVSYAGIVVGEVADADITKDDVSPNVIVMWPVDFFIAFTPARYMVHLVAVEIATGSRRVFSLDRLPIIEIQARPTVPV